MSSKAAGHLAARVAELERIVSGLMTPGKVHEVDPAKQIMRLNMGKDTDGEDFLSPWVPYPQTAGAMKFHNPPSVGQQMMLMSPNGDMRQGIATPFHWSDENASPSDKGDEHVMTFGQVTVQVKDGVLLLKVGTSFISITPNEIYLKADKITTDGETSLDRGKRRVHYVDGKDTAGDLAVDGADRVYV